MKNSTQGILSWQEKKEDIKLGHCANTVPYGISLGLTVVFQMNVSKNVGTEVRWDIDLFLSSLKPFKVTQSKKDPEILILQGKVSPISFKLVFT